MPPAPPASASVHLLAMVAGVSSAVASGSVLTNCPGAGTYSSTASMYLL